LYGLSRVSGEKFFRRFAANRGSNVDPRLSAEATLFRRYRGWLSKFAA